MLKAGDIITVDFSEIEATGSHVVLEIRQDIIGTTELELGKYHTNLTDRIAQLLVKGHQTASFLRANKFKTETQTTDFYDTFGINEVRLTIKKTGRIGSPFTIGFRYPIDVDSTSGTNTGYPIGFNPTLGSVETTTELDEDLL